MNKLMARIVAVVMAVMMLGTVSFAANLNEGNNEIPASDEVNNFSDIWTVRAVAENGTVVAMYQGAKPGDIAIDPTKLGNSTYVDVTYSGKGATEAKTVRVGVNPAKPDNERGTASVLPTYVFNGLEYTGVAHVTHEFTPQDVVSKLGYYITATVGGATSNANEVVCQDTTISGEGTVEFDVVILNVPAEVTIAADYFIEY